MPKTKKIILLFLSIFLIFSLCLSVLIFGFFEFIPFNVSCIPLTSFLGCVLSFAFNWFFFLLHTDSLKKKNLAWIYLYLEEKFGLLDRTDMRIKPSFSIKGRFFVTFLINLIFIIFGGFLFSYSIIMIRFDLFPYYAIYLIVTTLLNVFVLPHNYLVQSADKSFSVLDAVKYAKKTSQYFPSNIVQKIYSFYNRY